MPKAKAKARMKNIGPKKRENKIGKENKPEKIKELNNHK